MSMDEAAESLNDYFNRVQSLIETNRLIQEDKDDMEKLIEVLGEELKLSRESEKQLREEMKTLLKTCDSFSSLRYTELAGNVNKLEEENKRLKIEIDGLTESFEREKTSLKLTHEEEIRSLIREHKQELQKGADELGLVNEDREKQKQILYSEIQLLQAQSAMQVDVMETKYAKQRADLNNKLRDVNLANTNLRAENQNLRGHYGMLLNDKEQLIRELENKLKNTEQALLETQYQLRNYKAGMTPANDKTQQPPTNDDFNNLNNFCNIESEFEIMNPPEPERLINTFDRSKASNNMVTTNAKAAGGKGKNRPDINTKYRPLEVVKNLTKAGKDADQDDDFEVNQLSQPAKKTVPTIYIGGSRFKTRGDRNVSASSFLPPLKECSIAIIGTATKHLAPKKRKLFNPDDLDYLEQLEGPD